MRVFILQVYSSTMSNVDGYTAAGDSDTDGNTMSEKTPLLVHSGNRNNTVWDYTSGASNDLPCEQADGNKSADTHAHQISATGEHCHVRTSRDNAAETTARRKLVIASVICLCFMIGEATGGIIANSLAVATDAAHLLTDLTSFLISLISIYIASRPATKRLNFGWYRAEVVGALLSVLLIWVVTAALVYLAVLRVISQDYEIDAPLMMIMAGLSVVFNICMCMILQNGGHGHSHGHSIATARMRRSAHSTSSTGDASMHLEDSHEDVMTVMMTDDNINVKAAFVHVIGDLLQSFGVLTAAYIIFYKPEWKLADPICTFVFSLLVLLTTVMILRDILTVLMEAAPRDISFSELRRCLCSLDGVRELHDMRLWSLTTTRAALSVHLAIDQDVDTQELLAAASAMVRERFGIHECTFQMEHYVSEMGDCTQCRELSD